MRWAERYNVNWPQQLPRKWLYSLLLLLLLLLLPSTTLMHQRGFQTSLGRGVLVGWWGGGPPLPGRAAGKKVERKAEAKQRTHTQHS